MVTTVSGLNAPVKTEALVAWWQTRHTAHLPSNCVCNDGGVCGSIESLARTIALRTPVSRSTLFRRISAGTITVDEADRFACALGVPVYAIWPGFDRAPVTAALSAPGTGRTLF